MPTGQHLKPEDKLSIFEDLMAAKDSHTGIAATHKVAVVTIDKLAQKLAKRKNGTSLRELAGIEAGKTSVSLAMKVGTRSKSYKKKYAHLYARIDRLRTSGWSIGEIGKHLKVPRSAVNYYLYYLKPGRKPPYRGGKGLSRKRQISSGKPPISSDPFAAVLDAINDQIKKLEAFRSAVEDFLKS